MIYAAIDIGSNAVRLLFSNVFKGEDGGVLASKITFIRVPLRLGEDVFSGGYIKEDSKVKLANTLQAFKQLIEIYETKNYYVCATAAMREASNVEDVLKYVKENVGIDIHVIDGLEEASIIRSAGGSFPNSPDMLNMFVDVGGGSTEISVIQGGQFLNSQSFQLGTLRILHGADTPEEWAKLDTWLSTFASHTGKINLIGSGGNINKITKLFGDNLRKTISANQLKKSCQQLGKLSLEKRMEKYNLRSDRADVILPAAQLFLHILTKIQAKSVIVPKFGLADGIVCKLFLEDAAAENSPQ